MRNSKLNSSTERCSECGYSRVDDIDYRCPKCNSRLKSPNERCLWCGYSRIDDVEFSCKRRNNIIKSCLSGCSSYGITKAGFKNWIKYNKTSILRSEGKYVFEGYKHQVKDYWVDNLNISESTASFS